MSNLREAAQQALEALDIACRKYGDVGSADTDWGRWDGAMTAIRAALEQDEKPVAKIRTWHKGGEQNAELWDWDDGVETLPDGEHLLYASAPLRAALEQQAEPEPVAWVRLESWKSGEEWPDDCFTAEKSEGLTPLYAAPPQRKPLTDAEIQELSQQHKFDSRMEKFVRVIERAHGIGEEV